MVVHVSNARTQETEAWRSYIGGQCGPCMDTLSQKNAVRDRDVLK